LLPLPTRFLACSLALVAIDAPAATREGSATRQVAWLRAEATPLRSIQPGDGDFSDLEPLRSVLAGKQVVVLGEATHGDGASFLAKTRLVHFLHQELGFDVLAFESGFYDCAKAWERIRAGEDPAAAFRQSVFSIWTRSVQMQPLIDYFSTAARSARPLELAGVDPQFTGQISERYLLGDLKRAAETAGLPADEFATRISGPLANLVSGAYEKGEVPPAVARAAFIEALDELARRLREVGGDIPERSFWLRFSESTRQIAANSWSADWSRPVLEDPKSYAVRDRLMGEQLAWLAQHRFAGRRIVVWANSFHAAREVDEIEVPSPVHMRLFRTFQPMGAVARRELGKKLYTVAVLAYQGSYGSAFRQRQPIELLRPSPDSLEDLFHRTGLPHAFLDLSRAERLPEWLRRPSIARAMGYKEMRARWGQVFDAILFIDRMQASEKQP